jgi:hypothetical protein
VQLVKDVNRMSILPPLSPIALPDAAVVLTKLLFRITKLLFVAATAAPNNTPSPAAAPQFATEILNNTTEEFKALTTG